MDHEKVMYYELLPHEFRARLAQRPIAWLPLGTLEWHGEHLPLGADAILSEGLMTACARRYGGIVMPPIHLGPDAAERCDDGTFLAGMDRSDATVPHRRLDGSCYWIASGLFNLLIDAILEQLKRAGFTAVFADGHGPSRGAWCQAIPDREVRFGLKLLGVMNESWPEWRSQTDHAAENETSLCMTIRPDLVDLSQLENDRDIWPQGVAGKDPRDSTAEAGQAYLTASLDGVEKILSENSV